MKPLQWTWYLRGVRLYRQQEELALTKKMQTAADMICVCHFQDVRA